MQRVETMENCRSPFVFQIINVGPRHDNEFEVKMLLSEAVDLSTLKITVKSNNLRVGVQRSVQGPGVRKSSVQASEKHSENFLVPEDFDGDRMISMTNVMRETGLQIIKAEMRIEGLKVMTAALAADDVLNIRLQEVKNPSAIRNINFFIPIEANAQMASVEVFGGETIYIRAPAVKIPP